MPLVLIEFSGVNLVDGRAQRRARRSFFGEKKTMKKILSLLTIVALLCTFTLGCGGDSDDATTGDDATISTDGDDAGDGDTGDGDGDGDGDDHSGHDHADDAGDGDGEGHDEG